ncbi:MULTISPECIES: phospholipase D family protein [unclassified Microbacterium]|uniref:phospholipase D family protein n=1 Tax=unclassified Microbacterium TaxID=2609290 RepID=UPI00300F95D6
MEEMLRDSDFQLIIGTDSITNTAAIAKLSALETVRPRLHIRAFVSPVSSLFHPKLAWFEHKDHLSLIVGSGNLTMGGLLSNWEAMAVERLVGDDATKTMTEIQQFVTQHAAALLPLSDARVVARVAANDGDERSIRRRAAPRSTEVPQAAGGTNEVLVAEIPASGGRWKQANFDLANYEGFFGAKRGSQRRIVLQSVSGQGVLGEIESRPSVEVSSSNYRFELAAAAGIPYPKHGAPIGVFVRLETGQFIYSLLLPGDNGYAEASRFLEVRWSGPAREKRRVRATVDELRAVWQDAPLWKAELPAL